MRGRPLPHAEEAVGVEPAGRARGEARAVVGDLEHGASRPSQRQRHVTWRRPGVALDVGDRLLGDAPQLPLLAAAAGGRSSLRSKVDREAAALAAPGRGTRRAWSTRSWLSVTSVRRS